MDFMCKKQGSYIIKRNLQNSGLLLSEISYETVFYMDYIQGQRGIVPECLLLTG